MSLKIGDRAPDIELLQMTADGLRTISLSDSRGKPLVLFFFPLAGSGVCTKEMCDVTEKWASFTAEGATIYGVSADNPFAQELWIRAHNIQVPMLSDYNHVATRAFDVVDTTFALDGMVQEGVAERSVFVIDAEGVIVHVQVSENPGVLPDLDAVENALAELAR